MRKLFKDIKAGDIIWTTFGTSNYELKSVKINNVEHITHETRHYKEWAYGEDEYFEVQCNKMRLTFDEIEDNSSWHSKMSSFEINLDSETSNSTSYENYSKWYTSRDELIEYYDKLIKHEKKKLDDELVYLTDKINKHNEKSEKFYNNVKELISDTIENIVDKGLKNNIYIENELNINLNLILENDSENEISKILSNIVYISNILHHRYGYYPTKCLTNKRLTEKLLSLNEKTGILAELNIQILPYIENQDIITLYNDKSDFPEDYTNYYTFKSVILDI